MGPPLYSHLIYRCDREDEVLTSECLDYSDMALPNSVAIANLQTCLRHLP